MVNDRGVPLLDLQAQYASLGSEMSEAINRVAASQRFIMGPEVEAFEASFAEYVGAAHAVGCASGTDALLLSLKTLDLGPGDEVITSPFTFFATAGAIHNAGGTPVFVDIEPDTFNIDPRLVEAALTERTRAIVPVHLFGQVADMETLHEIAASRGVAVIEDAAQAVGAKRSVQGVMRSAGTLGRAAAFSFFPSKNLGAWGDGGMVTTDDAKVAARVRRLRKHGGDFEYHHAEIGTNSRLDALQAAILSVKIRYLDGWNAARRERASRYTEGFASIDAVRTPRVADGAEHVFHQYTVRVARRDELASFLGARGIGHKVYYPVPLHRQECFASLGYAEGSLPESERAAHEVLSLPIFPELADEQIAAVIAAVEEFYA